jgi:plasmid stabilization system protein ParE
MRRYILAPEAALDLVEIWRYLKKKSNVEIAERVERAIREKIVFWRACPEPDTGAGT